MEKLPAKGALWEGVVHASPAHSKSFEAESGSHRPLHGGCGGSHPRGDTKGLAPALEQMLFYKEERRRRKMEGTPGHPNQPLGLHTASQDQVEWNDGICARSMRPIPCGGWTGKQRKRHGCVRIVRIVWEEIERHLGEEEP